jgi:hypothetical protein
MDWNFEEEQKIIDDIVNEFEQECDNLEKELDAAFAAEESSSK